MIFRSNPRCCGFLRLLRRWREAERGVRTARQFSIFWMVITAVAVIPVEREVRVAQAQYRSYVTTRSRSLSRTDWAIRAWNVRPGCASTVKVAGCPLHRPTSASST